MRNTSWRRIAYSKLSDAGFHNAARSLYRTGVSPSSRSIGRIAITELATASELRYLRFGLAFGAAYMLWDAAMQLQGSIDGNFGHSQPIRDWAIPGAATEQGFDCENNGESLIPNIFANPCGGTISRAPAQMYPAPDAIGRWTFVDNVLPHYTLGQFDGYTMQQRQSFWDMSAVKSSPRQKWINVGTAPVWWHYPSVAPSKMPIGQTVPTPKPVPYRLLPILFPRVGETPERSTRSNYPPAVNTPYTDRAENGPDIEFIPIPPGTIPIAIGSPGAGPMRETQITPAGPIVLAAPHATARPARGVHEKKIKIALTGAGRAIFVTTEFNDFVNALYNAIPKQGSVLVDRNRTVFGDGRGNVLYRAQWNSSQLIRTGLSSKFDEQRRDRPSTKFYRDPVTGRVHRTVVDPATKLNFVFDHLGAVDILRAIRNLAVNEAGDHLWGKGGQISGQQSQLLGIPGYSLLTGFGRAQ